MAKSVRTGSTGNRMSSIVAGDKSGYGASTVRLSGALQNPRYGSPVSRLKDYVGAQVVNPSKVGLEKPKTIPRTFVPTARPPVKKPVAAKKPAAQVISNVTNAKFSPTPTQNSAIKNKPPATRFGTVTGKTTGTRVSGGGGYGGGGTRGGGSLSGQGSGSRTAGTSRTGGTRNNDPVRG